MYNNVFVRFGKKFRQRCDDESSVEKKNKIRQNWSIALKSISQIKLVNFQKSLTYILQYLWNILPNQNIIQISKYGLYLTL